jgi:hypothetical protein
MMLTSIGFVAKPMTALQVIDEFQITHMKRDGHTYYQEALFVQWIVDLPLATGRACLPLTTDHRLLATTAP